jgi:glycine cleavage system aminomethyltransferase T
VIEAIRRSPVTRWAVARGARVALEAGWEVAASFGDPDREAEALRGSVGLADVSLRGKVDVRGAVEGPLALAGDAFVARLSPTWALLLVGPGAEGAILDRLGNGGAGALVTDATDPYAAFAVAGPRADDAFERLTSWDPASLGAGEAAAAPVAGVPAVLARRTEGPAAVEVLVGSEWGAYAWESILEVVSRVGGAPVGLEAMRAAGWR